MDCFTCTISIFIVFVVTCGYDECAHWVSAVEFSLPFFTPYAILVEKG